MVLNAETGSGKTLCKTPQYHALAHKLLISASVHDFGSWLTGFSKVVVVVGKGKAHRIAFPA